MHRASVRRLLAASVGLVSFLGQPGSVAAIDIQIVFNGASATPSYDPTGTSMLALFGYAEQYYEDIFQDSGAGTTLTLNVWYENLDPISTGILARHDLVTQNANRELTGNIRIDTDRTWFIDSTPANDSEFTMQQTLVRDLTPTQLTNAIDGFAIENFEVGYGGSATGSAPADAQSGYDMLTVVLREVGHALGLDENNNVAIAETADGDYDLDGSHVSGYAIGMKTNSPANIGLLAQPTTLMGPSVPTGTRRRPSHADLFSMAVGNNYSSLDVPRREFYESDGDVISDWSDATKWSGGAVPGANDDAFVRTPSPIPAPNGIVVRLTGPGTARNLVVADDASVLTQSFKLSIVNQLTINGPGSDVIVDAGGEVEADELHLTNGGRVFSSGLIDVGRMSIDDLSSATASDITSSQSFSNNGTLSVNAATGLNLNPVGGASINLDGARVGTLGLETGRVIAILADLNVNGALTDSFNGSLTIGKTATFAQPWVLGGLDAGTFVPSGTGVLTFDNPDPAAAVLAGAPVEVKGHIEVRDGNFGRINAQSTFEPGATVTVNNNGTLEINAPATLHGGTFAGLGTLVWDDAITIDGSVFVGTSGLDLDGAAPPAASLTINNGATLAINYTSTLTDPHSGAVTIRGTLDTLAELAFNGTLLLSSGTITGGGAIDLGGANAATAGGSGLSRVYNPLITGMQTLFTVDTGSTLRLSGTGTFNGGTFGGGGTLGIGDGHKYINGDVTFATSNINIDAEDPGAGTITIRPGARLNITGGVIDTLGGHIAVESGTLVLNNASGVPVTGTLTLDNTTGTAARINGSSAIVLAGGNLRSLGAGLNIVNAPFSAQAGTLLVEVANQLNVNGSFSVATGQTLLRTGGGTLRIAGAQNHAGGTLNLSSGTTIFETDPGLPSSSLNLLVSGGTAQFNSSQTLNALAMTGGHATLAAGGNRVLKTRLLFMSAGAPAKVLDLTSNDLIVDYTGSTPLTTIRAYLVSGRNGGDWMGPGLTSTAAAADPTHTALGIADNAALGVATFAGQGVDATSILVKYTYLGDANLDGQVDISDLARLATAWQTSGDWINGDFDYSGFVDITDLAALATNWQAGVGAPLGMSLDQALAAVGLGGVPIPEPVALALATAGFCLTRRGRRIR